MVVLLSPPKSQKSLSTLGGTYYSEAAEVTKSVKLGPPEEIPSELSRNLSFRHIQVSTQEFLEFSENFLPPNPIGSQDSHDLGVILACSMSEIPPKSQIIIISVQIFKGFA